jgi:hypothetical protein
MDETTIGWFAKVLRSKQAMALIKPIAGQLVTELLSSTDVMDVWQRNRGPDVHSITTMNEAIAERFVPHETRSAPYLYRYLIPVLAETSKAASFVSDVFQQETLLGQRGEVVLLGRRIVASPRPSECEPSPNQSMQPTATRRQSPILAPRTQPVFHPHAQ